MNDTLPIASDVARDGTWVAPASDVVVLAYDDRHRRRRVMEAVHGTRFLMDLATATALHGGDALRLADGRLIEIVAAPEPLVEVSAGTPGALMRIAWHLGNRHLPVQLTSRHIRLRRDHVIEAMIEGLGGRVRLIEAPFDPESGAYAGSMPEAAGHHSHDHHGHDHHGHDHHHHGASHHHDHP